MWRPKKWNKVLLKELKKVPDQELPEGNVPAALLLFAEAGANAMLKITIAWLLKYDNYSQYTGRDHSDLVRRLDIPNKDMEAFTGKKY